MTQYLRLTQLRELLAKHGVRPNKSLGQHFLVDGNIIDFILRQGDVSPPMGAIEIGAGPGCLTLPLAHRCGRLETVEIDSSMVPVLEELVGDMDHVRLHWQDALQTDWERLAQDWPPQAVPATFFGNLPYYITSPLLQSVLHTSLSWRKALFMVQKEVADRLIAEPGGKEYGVLTVTVQFRARVHLLKKISRHAFYPRPEVDSALVELEPRERKELGSRCSDASFYKVVRGAFGLRRKTLFNALKKSPELSLSPSEAIQLLDGAGIDGGRRAETLGLAEFVYLAASLDRMRK